MSRNKTVIIRKIKEDPTESLRLLDDDDMNLGSIFSIPPNPNIGPGVPQRLIDVQCASRKAEFVTISFNILPTTNDVNDSVNFSGPLVGIVEFGNGGAFNTVEIDIPNGNNFTNGNILGLFPSPTSWAAMAGTVPAGGTAISVPGSSVRVYARNDANQAIYSPTATASVSQHPIKVQASIAYGIRTSAHSRNFRSQIFSTPNGAGGIVPPATEQYIGVPPFAKSVFLYRGPSLPAVTVRLLSRQLFGVEPGLNMETYTIAGGVNAPEIPLSGLVDQIGVTNTGIAGEFMTAVFSIGL